MKSKAARRFLRRSAPSNETSFFKKENKQEQQFFGSPSNETFFQPNASIQRKCEKCEKEDKKLQRVEDKKENSLIEHGPPSAEPPITDVTKEEEKQDEPKEILVRPAGPICTPLPLDRANFLAKTGNKKDSFGITILDPNLVAYPAVVTKPVKGGVILEKTDSFLPVIPSYYTKKSEFFEDDAILSGESYCHPGRTSKRYPNKWMITADGAAAIEKGEIDHCRDYQHAFDISIGKYCNTVNKFAIAKTKFNDLDDCKKKLKEKKNAGVDPGKWIDVFLCLIKKTLERDNSAHVPNPKRTNPDQIKDPLKNCQYFIKEINSGSLPNVGKPDTPTLIKGCGE